MLTPFDIQNRTLKTTMGGYNKKDTDEFLAQVYESFEAVYKENRDLKEKITSLSEGIQYYKQMENSLQKALILAEKTSTETQDEAQAKADALVREAQEKADTIVKEAQEKADALVKETKEQTDTLVRETKEQTDALTSETRIKADALNNETKAKTDEMLRDAKAQADLMKVQAERDLVTVKENIQKLVKGYENYRIQFKKLVSEQLDMLESDSFKIYAPSVEEEVYGNSSDLNMADSSVMNNGNADNDISDSDDINNNRNNIPDKNDMNNNHNNMSDKNNMNNNHNNMQDKNGMSNNRNNMSNKNNNRVNNGYDEDYDKTEFVWDNRDKRYDGSPYRYSDDEAAVATERNTSNGRYKNNRRYSSKGNSKSGRGNAKFSKNNTKQNKSGNPFTFIDTED